MAVSKFKKANHKNIAKERIAELFKQASMLTPEDIRLANRYVELARKIGMKFQITIPNELKKRFCPKCHTYWFWGTNARKRTRDNKIIISCSACKQTLRYKISVEK